MHREMTYERAVGLGLFGVMVTLSWPIWIMIAASQHAWTPAVTLSTLVPLALTLLWVGIFLGVVGRVANVYEHAIHGAAHVLHGGLHRHA